MFLFNKLEFDLLVLNVRGISQRKCDWQKYMFGKQPVICLSTKKSNFILQSNGNSILLSHRNDAPIAQQDRATVF